MTRTTTLTVIMMLISVAAAIASTPTEASPAEAQFQQRTAHAVQLPAPLIRNGLAWSIPAHDGHSAQSNQAPAACDDVTAPYRRMHNAGMKLPPDCRPAEKSSGYPA